MPLAILQELEMFIRVFNEAFGYNNGETHEFKKREINTKESSYLV